MSGGDGLDATAFAELLVGYCLNVAADDQVLVRSTTLAAPLLLELQRAVLARGAWPLLRTELPGQAEAFFRDAGDAQLDHSAPLALTEVRDVACVLGIQAPENTRALAGVDPDRLRRAGVARKPLQEAVMQTRWCATLWPTHAGAQEAGMGLADFERFVSGAMFLDHDDPVAAWADLRDVQQRLIERLTPARELRIEADGTDLRLSVAGRTWINDEGRHNMPGGEVFTGPHEDSATGQIRFTLPSSPAGVEVDGVELSFDHGEVVSARAQRGDDYLQRALATDAGARRLGELGIGSNRGITRSVGAILFDEKIGGSVHLALGRSYPETGGLNDSALHWDMICDLREGGRLSADGETIQENGEFVGL